MVPALKPSNLTNKAIETGMEVHVTAKLTGWYNRTLDGETHKYGLTFKFSKMQFGEVIKKAPTSKKVKKPVQERDSSEDGPVFGKYYKQPMHLKEQFVRIGEGSDICIGCLLDFPQQEHHIKDGFNIKGCI